MTAAKHNEPGGHIKQRTTRLTRLIRLTNLKLVTYTSNQMLFSARQHAEHAICYRKSAHLSVCPSHEWISRKWLKLGSCSFHHTVAPSLCFLWYKFHPEILKGSHWAGASNKVGLGIETCYFHSSNAFARWQHKLELTIAASGSEFKLFASWRHSCTLTVASAALSCYYQAHKALY